MDSKPKFSINKEGEFVIEGYNRCGPFSNFLPGIAGLFGIPMWVFYTNRAQGVCSFGVKSKDSPIMEFLPANRAYQLTSSQGFRTFLKLKKGKKAIFYEPFQSHFKNGSISLTQRMYISSAELRIVEIAPSMGLQIEILYFTIPNEPFAALARVVTLRNISKKDISLDMLDGAPLMIPCGVTNFFLQKMRRTVEAWMVVENLKKKAPFYRLRVDPSDISEVSFIDEGNFYLSSISMDGKTTSRVQIFADPECIFGEVNDFSYPIHFIDEKGLSASNKQMLQNKLPCAMSLASFKLKKKKEITLYSLFGHMGSKEKLDTLASRLTKKQFFVEKRDQNKNIIKKIQEDVFTSSGSRNFDLYCAQTFLDNLMRGGYPVTCTSHPHTFYVYSRKHGDLERDYNRFYIDPTYFSQGNGNFRDMNQNRREDIFFNPNIKDSNILHFYNLMQLDGFNPLVLRGVRFKLKHKEELKTILDGKMIERDIEKIGPLLLHDFTPGELFMELERLDIKLKVNWHDFLDTLLKNARTIYTAEHSEGFWIDHWTYNLDLVESYLSIFPERLKEILLEKKEFTFYDNILHVKPRSRRCMLNGKDNVRQYSSLEEDIEKGLIIKRRRADQYTVRRDYGKGEIYKTTLIVKILCLIANKISSFDPFGKGIEMEADKPGWCDSMNGLPALFGSSMPEVFELKRNIVFLLESFRDLDLGEEYKISMPEELCDFLKKIHNLIKAGKKSRSKEKEFHYWDKANSIKERYRDEIRFGVSGEEQELSLREIKNLLLDFSSKLELSIKKAYIPSQKVYATYFMNEVIKYEHTKRCDPEKGLPLVRPLRFKSMRLPLFLEGCVRAMKLDGDKKKLKKLYQALKKTGLYDKKLKMYKLNESLESVTKEVGRSSIFTPGWLENESIWLHMEYKYLLEILKAKLFKEFFEEFRNILIPFQRPEVYGRSIFENSSFIVSSAFPEKRIHGKGFVARLSGSTAEMLNIWVLMNVGDKPFFVDRDEKLCLRFKPVLPNYLFSKKAQNGLPKDSYAFKFLGKTTIIYHNPRMRNTAGTNSVKIRFIVMRYSDGKKVEIRKDIINWPYSEDVRDRKVEKIDIYLG